MEPHGREELKGPVLHIVVVGFHHKKGCQVSEPLLKNKHVRCVSMCFCVI